MRTCTVLLIVLSLSVTSHFANATLLYTSEASSVFSLVSSGGLEISYELGTEVPMTFAAGSGIASIVDDTQTIIGDTLTQTSNISGSVGPGSGISESSVLNDILVILENTSALAATAEFSFTYTWFVEILQSDPVEALFEAGFANAFFHLSGFAPSGGETLAIDEGLGAGIVGMPDWEVDKAVSFDFFDTGTSVVASGSTTVTVYVTVPSMSIDSFDVITDASGFAVRVSEPTQLSVLIGWILLVFLHRRKFM